jgi:hypothetical protein
MIAHLINYMMSDRPSDRLPIATRGERADIERILTPLLTRIATKTRPVCREVLTSFGTALLTTWEPRAAASGEFSAPTSDHDPIACAHNWDLASSGFACTECGVYAQTCVSCGATLWSSAPCPCTMTVAA